jgi:hypothetical protein
MAITLNGSTGVTTPAVTNEGAYTGDGVVFADSTPSNTLVTTTGGNVGIGVSNPAFRLVVQDASSATRTHVINTNNAAAGAGVFLEVYNGGTQQSGVTLRADNADNFAIFNKVGERMRIDSSGNLLVGTTSLIGGGGKINISTNLAPQNGFNMINNTNNTGNTFVAFHNYLNNLSGTITQPTATSVAYNTSSDYRLKENIAPMTGALAKVSLLKPVTYTWKDGGQDWEGFIAHEVQEVIPQAITGEKDAVNEDGSIKPQGIDTSFLVATLTAAIQEQQAIITDLKSRIEALEQA